MIRGKFTESRRAEWITTALNHVGLFLDQIFTVHFWRIEVILLSGFNVENINKD